MEKPLNEKELNDVFLDVRKSYRLLYLYQRRVMDLVAFIGNHYGFQYVQGSNDFANSKSATQLKSLKDNAWSLLSMYVMTFQFSTKNFGKFEKVELLVSIVSDTGFYDLKKRENTDKKRVDIYNDVEKSETQLHLILKTTSKLWASYRNEMFPVDIDGSEEDVKKKDNIDDFLIGKKYDLSDFMNEESTLDKLKDFENFCSDNGIVLRPNK
jgi:hypothetical protein